MTVGSKFLTRVLAEAAPAEDRDGVKDGFNIPLDSQARAMAAKLKLPYAKRLVAFHFMCGVPGRYMNTSEVTEAIAGAADMLRKKVAVRRAFTTLYDALAAAKGFTIPSDGAVQEASKAKRGGFIQKLLESVLVELGLPAALITTTGPSAVGTGVYRTAELIEQDSAMEKALRLLAARMGIKGNDAQEPIEEAVDKSADAKFTTRGAWLKAAKALGSITIRPNKRANIDLDQAVVGDAENRGKGASIGEWDNKTNSGFLFADAAKRASRYAAKVDEAVDVGNDEFAQAVTALVSALGIPDDVLERRRTQIVQALRAKKATLRNRGQILTMMTRLQDLISKGTIEQGGQQPAETNEAKQPVAKFKKGDTVEWSMMADGDWDKVKLASDLEQDEKGNWGYKIGKNKFAFQKALRAVKISESPLQWKHLSALTEAPATEGSAEQVAKKVYARIKNERELTAKSVKALVKQYDDLTNGQDVAEVTSLVIDMLDEKGLLM